MEFTLKDLVRQLQLDQDLPDPDTVSYYANAKNRTFFIDYEIERDEETCYSRLMELAKIIIRMNMDEMHIPKDKLRSIYIFIDSYGGDISQTLFLCDLIKASRIPIITISTSVSMSAGLLLLISGHKKYAFDHSQILIHQGYLGLQGNASEVKEATKNYNRMLGRMKSFILDNTNIDEKTFERNKNKDWYLSASQAKKFGVVTDIVSSFEDIIQANTLEYNEYYDKPKNGFRKNTKQNETKDEHKEN